MVCHKRMSNQDHKSKHSIAISKGALQVVEKSRDECLADNRKR